MIVLVIITFVVVIPFVIYIAYPLYKYRHELIFKKRHVTLSVVAITMLIFATIAASLMQIMFVQLFASPNIDHERWFQILTLFVSTGGYFVVLGFYSAILIRLFLTYFNIHYQILSGSKWKNVIDKSYLHDQVEILGANFCFC